MNIDEVQRKRQYVKTLKVGEVVYKNRVGYRVEQAWNGDEIRVRSTNTNFLYIWGIFDVPDYQFGNNQPTQPG